MNTVGVLRGSLYGVDSQNYGCPPPPESGWKYIQKHKMCLKMIFRKFPAGSGKKSEQRSEKRPKISFFKIS